MKGNRFAAVDIGTNTILILIAEVAHNGTFRVLHDQAEITRLGEGVDQTRRLGSEGQARSLKALKDYREKCKGLAVDEIAVVGTSALRDAENSGDFKSRLQRELGWDLRVLNGVEEASYSYLAVQKGLSLRGKEVLVVDVGGGSTELIWGREDRLYQSASLDVGSVRLTERFLPSDPVREEEYVRLIAGIDRELENLRPEWRSETHFDRMVGIAGTFTTLAAVQKKLKQYSHSEVHGSHLDQAEVKQQIRLFKGKTIAERKAIAGLEPQRADVILAGAALIDRVMEFFLMDRVVVSDQGIRYGLLYEKLAGC
jgi:exopolyphosphatase/guanosine-5'-triphosphate,3'-diphosphate pyrophosphatase